MSSSGCLRAFGAREGRPFRSSLSRWRKAASSTSANSRSTAFAYHRDTDSFAFPFESQTRRHLLPDRLAGLGVPDGPLRGDLAEGRPVVLADGRNIDPEDVLGPPEGRKKLVVVGDTETTDGLTCLMIRPGTFRVMMAVWQCGRKRTKCCDACKTAD